MCTIADSRGEYGIQLHTCHGCLKHYCLNCRSDGSSRLIDHCTECDRVYCADCSPVLRCAHVDNWRQWPCAGQCCSSCAKDLFPSAEPSCSDCGNFYCDRHMAFCPTCDDDGACCNNCRVKRSLEGGGSKRDLKCDSCRLLLFPLLKERIWKLTKDNNQLRDEIKSLRKSDQEGGN